MDEALRVREELSSKQEAAARRAIELDPNLAEGYLALSIAGPNRQNLVLRPLTSYNANGDSSPILLKNSDTRQLRIRLQIFSKGDS